MQERRKSRNRAAGPVLDQNIVQDLTGPHKDINTLQILDLSHNIVANKLGIAPDAYSPTLQGDLLSVLPSLTSLALRDYSMSEHITCNVLYLHCSDWRTVDLFSESKSLRILDLRGNQVEVSAIKRLLSLLPGIGYNSVYVIEK